jgi:hypothetical protein
VAAVISSSGCRQPHRRLRFVGGQRTAHRGTEVVVLGLERGEPFQLFGAAKMRLGGLGEFGEVGEMRMASQVRFARLREAVRGVLLDRAGHPVARCAVALSEQQRLLGQRGEQLVHLLLFDRSANADPLGCFQACPAREHR